MSELEPCPFCGGLAEISTAVGESWAVCLECGANGPMFGSAESAAAAWNTRAAVTPEQFSFAVHNGEAWARVRTCEMSLYADGPHYLAIQCSECGSLSMTLAQKPKFCQWCGAKVVG